MTLAINKNQYAASIKGMIGNNYQFSAANIEEALDHASDWARSGDWWPATFPYPSEVVVSVYDVSESSITGTVHFIRIPLANSNET